jgi:nucleoside-diphosphate-sugar epimerase
VRVLLTGGNGYLGSHVADRLAATPEVELRLMLRRTANMKFLSELPASSYERVEGDLRNPESLRRAVQGIDAVAHVGGVTSALSEAAYREINVLGTADLVMAAQAAGVKRFVYMSSLAAQGPSPDGSDLGSGLLAQVGCAQPSHSGASWAAMQRGMPIRTQRPQTVARK